MIGLIKLTNYLLDQQLRQLEEAFVKDGGLREHDPGPPPRTRERQAPMNLSCRHFRLWSLETPDYRLCIMWPFITTKTAVEIRRIDLRQGDVVSPRIGGVDARVIAG
jgi:hypothetical protein